MVPVHRTEKALASSFAGSGEVEFQSKSICLSTRVMAGGPVSESLLKYSAFRPSSLEPGCGAELRARDDDRSVLSIRRALRVENFGGVKLLDDSVDRQRRVLRDSVVVALDCGEFGRVRANDGDGFVLLQQRAAGCCCCS